MLASCGASNNSHPPAVVDIFPFAPQAIFFVNSNDGWAAGGNAIFKTTTGGKTWNQQLVVSPTNTFESLDFVNKNDGWATDLRGAILATLNGGTNWSTLQGPVPLINPTKKHPSPPQVTSTQLLNKNDAIALVYHELALQQGLAGILYRTNNGGNVAA